MPIDTTAPEPAEDDLDEVFDGWRVSQLAPLLQAQARQCEAMHARWRGEPPLPETMTANIDGVPVQVQTNGNKFAAFQRKAGRNYERVIVSALASRVRVRAFRTEAEQATTGADSEASKVWRQVRGNLVLAEGIEMALNMGRSALVLGQAGDDSGRLVLTAEDPRQMLVVTDPAEPQRVLEALKMVHNSTTATDELFLYRTDGTTARVRVATRRRRARAKFDRFGEPLPIAVPWSAQGFDWDDERSGDLPELAGRLPIEPLVNSGEVAEFQPHLNTLDSINHRTYQQLVIGAYQAFKQRVMKGDFVDPETKKPWVNPQTGEPVDFNDLYQASPDGLWLVPKDADIWESGTVDMTGILAATKDDVRALSSQSSTPFYTFTPDVEGGSAAGAELQREQITFKVIDRHDRFGPAPSGIIEIAFAYRGDTTRSGIGTVETVWQPAQRYSLAERGVAATAAKASGMPWRDIMTEIWQFDDGQVDRMESHRDDDLLLAQQVAQQEAAAQAAAAAAAQSRAAA